jgi:hypothetical protein
MAVCFTQTQQQYYVRQTQQGAVPGSNFGKADGNLRCFLVFFSLSLGQETGYPDKVFYFTQSLQAKAPNVVVEGLTLFRIRGVPGSILGPDDRLSSLRRAFPQFLQANSETAY